MNTQVVAARTVAEVLAELATLPDSAPRDRADLEVAGPRAERLVELAGRWWRTGESLRVEESTEFFSESELYDRRRRCCPAGREAGRPDVRGVAEGPAALAESAERSRRPA